MFVGVALVSLGFRGGRLENEPSKTAERDTQMAWLQRKTKDGNFLILFRFRGHKFSRSLRTKSEAEALTRKARLEETIGLVEHGRLVVPTECDDVAEFLLTDGKIRVPIPQPQLVTLEQAFAGYLQSLPRDAYEQSTLSITRFRMNVLRRIIGKNTPIGALNKSKLQEFVNRRSEETGKYGRPIHPSTIKSDLRVLSVVWTYAEDEGIVDSPFPGRRLRLPKAGAKLPFQTVDQVRSILDCSSHTPQERKEVWQRVFLTVEEIDKLLNHVETTADYPFVYPMFVMAAHTGARRSELIRSFRDDVIFDAQLMSIREKKRVRGRQSIRTVPMSTRLMSALSTFFDNHPGGSFTFQPDRHLRSANKTREIGDGITRDEAHNYFKRTLANSPWCELPGWHCLRHSFISNCASKGIDQRTIMSWVGHMTAEMQERYRHLVPSQMQKELNQVFE